MSDHDDLVKRLRYVAELWDPNMTADEAATSTLLREAADALAAPRETAEPEALPIYEGFPDGVSDAFCKHAAVATSQYNTTARALAAEVIRHRTELAALRARETAGTLTDAHRWELERLLERVRRDDADNFPAIQALEAAIGHDLSGDVATIGHDLSARETAGTLTLEMMHHVLNNVCSESRASVRREHAEWMLQFLIEATRDTAGTCATCQRWREFPNAKGVGTCRNGVRLAQVEYTYDHFGCTLHEPLAHAVPARPAEETPPPCYGPNDKIVGPGD